MSGRRKPDFVLRMQGEREVLEVYGWPLPPVKNPGADAEPTTSQAADVRAAVGRTAGSIPATGANRRVGGMPK